MGIYEEFTTGKNEARFDSIGDLCRGKVKYSLKTKRYEDLKDINPLLLSGGYGGLPLAWDADTQNVFVDSSDAHSLIIGSTGAKKSRLVAIPTVLLLSKAGESLIVSDPKAEIYKRTAKELEKNGYRVCTINLREPSFGSSWNPLNIPFEFYCNGEVDKAHEFINDIAFNLMLGDDKRRSNDPFWDNSSYDLLFGLILLLIKYCIASNQHKTVTIENILRLSREIIQRNTHDSITLNNDIFSFAQDNDILASKLYGLEVAAPQTQMSILTSFTAAMNCFILNDKLTAMLSHNDIDLSEVGSKKTAIFLIVPDEKSTYHKLASMFIKQSYEYFIYLAQKKHEGKLPLRINYVLDEFSALPTISDFPNMITAARSRNIRFNLFIQSQEQLLRHYPLDSSTIKSNCINWIFLHSRENSLLAEISGLCGMKLGKPLLSINALQQLDKEKGQVLIMSNRAAPTLSFLPDISLYDNDKFEVLQDKNRKNRSTPKTDFSKFKDLNKLREKDDFSQNIPKIDFSRFIESSNWDEKINSSIPITEIDLPKIEIIENKQED